MKNGYYKIFNSNKLIFIVLLFIFILSVETVRIKSKLKTKSKIKSSSKTKADDDVDSNDIPSISVHLEDHDGDPLNFVKFNDERRDLSIRYAEMQMRYDAEKKALMKLMTHQTAKLAELTELAQITSDIVDRLV